jgi:uncharacterized lipoprotein YajG
MMPHDVAITAEVPYTSSSVGDGVTLALQVIDDRDDVVVGRRMPVGTAADITAKNIIPALERELKEGLEAKGFEALSAQSDADAEFEARLRRFNYFIRQGRYFGATENTWVVINIEAKKRGKAFERRYRVHMEEPLFFVTAGTGLDRKLNAALSEVLARIMRDAELMSFLAQ